MVLINYNSESGVEREVSWSDTRFDSTLNCVPVMDPIFLKFLICDVNIEILFNAVKQDYIISTKNNN